MAKKKIEEIKFDIIYDAYLTKIARKDKSKEELDIILSWLTGYSSSELSKLYNSDIDLKYLFENAPNLNENRFKITGLICGIRVEDIEEELTKEIRYMDKLVDELYKGKKLENILRK